VAAAVARPYGQTDEAPLPSSLSLWALSRAAARENREWSSPALGATLATMATIQC
jgi:hypothetical protein